MNSVVPWSAYIFVDDEKLPENPIENLLYGSEEGVVRVDSSKLQNLLKLIEKTDQYQPSKEWMVFEQIIASMIDGPEGLLEKVPTYTPDLYENIGLFNKGFGTYSNFRGQGKYKKFLIIQTSTEKKLDQLFKNIQKELIAIDTRVDSYRRNLLDNYLQMSSPNADQHFGVITDLLAQAPKCGKNLRSTWNQDRIALVQKMFEKWAYFGLEPQVLAFVLENKLENRLKQATQEHLGTFFRTSLKEFDEYLSKVEKAKILTDKEIQVWKDKKRKESRSSAAVMLAVVIMAVFTVYLRQLIRE